MEHTIEWHEQLIQYWHEKIDHILLNNPVTDNRIFQLRQNIDGLQLQIDKARAEGKTSFDSVTVNVHGESKVEFR